MAKHQSLVASKCQIRQDLLLCKGTAHIQRRQHFRVQKNVTTRFIVSHPDSANGIPNIGERKTSETLLRSMRPNASVCCSCHIVAKQVMYLVVTGSFAIHIMIKSAVIFVKSRVRLARPAFSKCDLTFFILVKLLSGKFLRLFHSLRNRKIAGSFIMFQKPSILANKEKLYLSPKPLSGILVQKIRENEYPPGHTAATKSPILPLAEASFPHLPRKPQPLSLLTPASIIGSKCSLVFHLFTKSKIRETGFNVKSFVGIHI